MFLLCWFFIFIFVRKYFHKTKFDSSGNVFSCISWEIFNRGLCWFLPLTRYLLSKWLHDVRLNHGYERFFWLSAEFHTSAQLTTTLLHTIVAQWGSTADGYLSSATLSEIARFSTLTCFSSRPLRALVSLTNTLHFTALTSHIDVKSYKSELESIT